MEENKKSPQVDATTSEEDIKKNLKEITDSALIDGEKVSRISPKKYITFPIISVFENGIYTNNGHTETLQTGNRIVTRPYQP